MQLKIVYEGDFQRYHQNIAECVAIEKLPPYAVTLETL